MTVSKKQPPTYRLISLDGGGIYGYNTVLMLRALAERNPGFLCAKKKYIFAGTSAGALISLLLAKEENLARPCSAAKLNAFLRVPGCMVISSTPSTPSPACLGSPAGVAATT